MANFINPANENVIPGEPTNVEEVFEYIINEWLAEIRNIRIVEDNEDNKRFRLFLIIGIKEVVTDIIDLLNWVVEKDVLGFNNVRALRRMKKKVEIHIMTKAKQTTLLDFYKGEYIDLS